MTYSIRFSPFLNKYYIYNNITKETQSFWKTSREARKVAIALGKSSSKVA